MGAGEASFISAWTVGGRSLAYVCHFDTFLASQKTILSVELRPKCMHKILKVISNLVRITSIVLDPSKKTVTVTDKIIKKVGKFRKYASIVSTGAAKDEKKDDRKDLMILHTKDMLEMSCLVCCGS